MATRLDVQAAEKATQPTGSVHFMKLRRLTPLSGSAGFFSSEALIPGPMVFERGVGLTTGGGPPGVIGVMGGYPLGGAGRAGTAVTGAAPSVPSLPAVSFSSAIQGPRLFG